MFDLNNLPVSPEFVDSLQENALETAKAHLEKLKVPKDVIDLVGKVYDLGYYIAECYRHPEELTRDVPDRFDIEATVIETVNLVAELGGTFHGPVTYSQPRTSAAALFLLDHGDAPKKSAKRKK